MCFEYKPLLRMVAVALMHPLSPSDGWQDSSALDRNEGNGDEGENKKSNNELDGGKGKTCAPVEYVLTPALHGIVQNRCVMKKTTGDHVKALGTSSGVGVRSPNQRQSEAYLKWLERKEGKCTSEGANPIEPPKPTPAPPNDVVVQVVASPYRSAILSFVSGSYGHSIFLPANMLLNSIVECKAVGSVILVALKVLPESLKKSRRGSHGFSINNNHPQYHPLTVNTGEGANLPVPVRGTGRPYGSWNGSSNSNGSGAPPVPLVPYQNASHMEIENSISTFLSLPQPSERGAHLLEAAGALAMAYLQRLYRAMSGGGGGLKRWNDYVGGSKLVKNLIDLRVRMAKEATEFMNNNVFKHMFVDLFEEQIVVRYSGKNYQGLVCMLNR